MEEVWSAVMTPGCKLTVQDNKLKMSAGPVCHQIGAARMFAALVHSYTRGVILTFGILQGGAVSGRELSLCLPSSQKIFESFRLEMVNGLFYIEHLLYTVHVTARC